MAPSIRSPSIPHKYSRRKGTAALSPFLKRILQIIVLLVVLYYEYWVFWASVRSCHFDISKGNGEEAFKVLVLADPQLLDMRSYPGRNTFFKRAGILATDAYLRRAWHFVISSTGERRGGVDAVIWLGDLLDSGVDTIAKEEYSDYVHRFNRLFPLPRSKSSSSFHGLTPPIPTILIGGNHDLGLHLGSEALSEFSRERFIESFGSVAGSTIWNDWEVVWIDSMGLLEPVGEEVGDEARRFVNELGNSTYPRILLTHIPLYRPPGTSCGAERESSNSLTQGSGLNYQNMLDSKISDWLLESIAPQLIYSGDDHDSCIVDHQSTREPTHDSIRETTVKSFSMAMGVKNPGFHLLTLYAPTSTSKPLSSQVNCTLPNQIHIWIDIYLRLLLLIVFVLLTSKLYLYSSQVRRSSSAARSNGLPVHSRTVSSIFGKERAAGLDDGEDEDSRFPTFDSSEYHSGINDETPLAASRLEKKNSQHVRRVSRVWEKWDKGGFFGIGQREHRGVLSNLSPEAGFLNRYLLRPVFRVIRSGLRRTGGTRLVNGGSWLVALIGAGASFFPVEGLIDLIGEVFQSISFGIAMWLFLQFFFWLWS